MKYRRNLVLALCLALAACGGAAPQAAPPPTTAPSLPTLVLHAFDRDDLANAQVASCGSWNQDPADTQTYARFQLDRTTWSGDTGMSLHLFYKLNPNRSSQNGFWMKLNQLDLSGYDHLLIRVRGDKERGFASSFKIEFKKPKPGTNGETDKGGYVLTGITDQWRTYTIPLNMMNGITDWKGIEEFVVAFHSRRADVKEGAYWIDNIELVKTGARGPGIWDPIPVPKKRAWEAANGGEGRCTAALAARLVGWPTIALADRKGFPADDREFVRRIARDTWKGIDALCDREHGLPLDTVRFGRKSVKLEESRIGDYTNVTNIGLYFLSVVGACDLDFLTRAEALERLEKTLAAIEAMEAHDGFLFNYYDTTSDERTSNFISFVDSAWLVSGLMAVRNTFPELKPRCDKLIDRMNFAFFYDDVEQHMNHGFYVNMGCRAEYNYGVFYTEPRAGSLIAIGKGDVPAEHWFRMQRTFPSDCRWQSDTPVDRREKTVLGFTFPGGHYEWQGERFVPSWGGSLFEALMPTMVIDEARSAPRSLGRNDLVHARVHRRYALEVLKYPVWGMSPSSMPGEDNYSEYGVRPLGTHGYKPGAVTPHVTGLAINFTPKEAIANFRELIRRYDIYGEYGFYDAVDPVTGDVAYKYLALDQEMLFIALANYLGDGCVQKAFMTDPIMKDMPRLLAAEDFLE